MTERFHATLLAATASERQALFSQPLILRALRGEVSRPAYRDFLQQAYHHVRHTVPLLQACRARIAARADTRLAWLLPALDEYIEEESGHEQWILDDIAAAGGDRAQAEASLPGHAAEVMVAYAYDQIARGNPLGFFGMVLVLEGSSVALALNAADRIQQALDLPDAAFSYLRSHGTLDQEHTAHFELLMDDIDDPADQAAIVHAARRFYRLYGAVFAEIAATADMLEAA
ncbi:iron-containing redox enzyme family protein [Piscinibacter sp. Jin2]|uniref:Iron-containing redox enzyme family protein n=1 Tax=Aquariibacter lacus TaxID=2801332 RepID=A0A9X1BNK4_9BURK|nr:iron-containing redox enzyme family protein [Piscinibacter lacus]MBL0720075.1 iron-containing redox enzyme family protein [Piscinibacter lacus]